MKFREKSVFGMIVGLFLGLIVAAIFVNYWSGIALFADVLSYVLLIALSLLLVLVCIGGYKENIEKGENKFKSIRRLVGYCALIVSVTTVILVIPEVRIRVFYALKILYIIAFIFTILFFFGRKD